MNRSKTLVDADCEMDLGATNLPLQHELLWMLEWVSLLGSDVYAGIDTSHGSGEPVIVVPGFLGSMGQLHALTGWLERIGYRLHGPGFDRNIECPDVLLQRLEQAIEDVHRSDGRRVRLIGHSLGGSLARAAAVRLPEMVEQVITLGSPLRSVSAHPAVVELARVLARVTRGRHEQHAGHSHNSTCACELSEALSAPFPRTVRRTAIYTRGDGVVDWRTCIDNEGRVDVEVTGTHIGLVVNAGAYKAIAAAIAGPAAVSHHAARRLTPVQNEWKGVTAHV